ncbi:carbohydrate sulfotransferase 3-like [Asterias rubens]|uniref:carbohydrate sulfotransferase 3-like n=1 Tax=Asterias rubens TaxID=7604 RepID=UPI001455B3AD|nr:carbohydrate sulfotransferase 3-like [Asterias rubens]
MVREIAKNFRVFVLGMFVFLSTACFVLLARNAASMDGSAVMNQQQEHRASHVMPTTVYMAVSPPEVGGGGEEGEIKVTENPHTGFQKSEQPRLCTSIPKPRTTEDTPSGVKIIILAAMRTGSSFVGEMFGQNSDIFYLFEPGLPLHNTLHQRGAVFLQPLFIDLLDSIYQCNLTGYEYYFKWLSGQVPEALLKKAPSVYKELCSKKSSNSSEFECGKMTPQHFMRICMNLNKVAIKSIRISDIGSLLPLIKDKTVNLKVIHLVRDPRGMIASRVLAMNDIKKTADKVETFTDDTRASLIDYCWNNLHNTDVGKNLPKFQDNYLLLRYEDVSLDPHEAARRIYNFTGLGAVPGNVSRWIQEHTSAHVAGTYSTSRVSSQVYQSWRGRLSFPTVKTIEEVGTCSQMMQRFGYLPAKDQEHLTNLNISLLSDKVPDVNREMYVI